MQTTVLIWQVHGSYSLAGIIPIESIIFWDVTPCSLVEVYRRFGEITPHHRFGEGKVKVLN
jgi:hypothetical protein